jgi:type VI secretion system protein ImpL
MTHSSRTTRWLASLGVLLAFLVIAVIAIWLLKLTGGDRTILLIGLALLGAAGAALTWHLLRPTDAVSRAEKDDAILALRQAADRLPRGELLRKSLVLVIGPPTSTKTTVVTRSGLDAQLLAGDARGTGPEESTKAANIWLAGGGAVVESPGALTADAGRFTRFVRAMRAPGLAVALGRREPAPRAIVLCIPCDFLSAADEAKQLDALAPTIRERLADAALQLGMRVPVYVLFTRFDKIPYVETWLAPLTREETRVPMGAALPFDSGAAGAYAERLVPRLEQAFSQLIASLSARRSDLLTRESVEARRLTSYEVPRELSKLAPAVIRFLVEVTRPSQMGMTPQLRGFWFSGARPVLVRDAAPEAASIPAPAAGATGLFRPGMQLDAAAAAPAAARKVPEWVFIDRFFTDVVFGDRSGRAAALGGVRVSGLRRVLLGGVIGSGLLLGLGVFVSWMGNRSLTSRTVTAARAVASLPIVQAAPGTIALPSGEALRTLEQLRSLIDSIASIDSAGAPFSLGFGLWNGKALIASARPAWVAGYRRQLHDDAWRSLTDSLRAVPAVPLPTSDYGRTYDMLKTYLVGTSEHAKSSSAFVTPVLLAAWQRGIATDTAVTELARKQFDTYAALQATEALWPVTGDLQLVGHARGHLNQFAGIDPIYVSMLSTVSATVKPLKLTDSVPQAAGVVSAAGAIVKGPFTAAGWRSMQDVLKNSDRFFQGETWVLGDRSAVSSRNRVQDLADIRNRYLVDYTSEWRTALRAVSVPRPGTVKESAMRLGKLGSAQSALLNVFSIVSHNTNVDTAVARVFQPVQSVTPASVKGKFVSESNEPYANALLQLQASMEQLGSLPAGIDTTTIAALKLAAQNVQVGPLSQARIAARQLEQKFAVDAEASAIGRVVAVLLQSPIDGAEAALQRMSNAPLPRVAAKPAAGGGGGGGAPPPAPLAPAVPTPAVGAPAAGAAVAAGVAAAAGADFAGSASGAELAVMLNERGKQLCRSMERILRKFPFSVDQGDASVSDVNALLAPGTGALWQFYDGGLQPLLPYFNGTYASRPTNGVTLSPQFVTFFRWMARASGALYMDKGATPRMSLSIKALATGDAPGTVTLYHGDRTPRLVPGAEAQTVSWPPSGGSSARLTVSVGGREQEIARADGPWALFRVMARATSTTGSGPTRVLTFSGAAPVALELTAAGVGGPVVHRGALTGPACVAQVVQ